MLPSKERLRRASVFQRAYNGRTRVNTPLVSLYVLPRQSKPGGQSRGFQSQNRGGKPDGSRVSDSWRPLSGFVVAKKVSKSACKRNRAKRRLREAYRLLRGSPAGAALELTQWYALIFVAHPPMLEATWQDVEKAVRDCLARAHSKLGRGRGQQNAASGQSKSATKNDPRVKPGEMKPRERDN